MVKKLGKTKPNKAGKMPKIKAKLIKPRKVDKSTLTTIGNDI